MPHLIALTGYGAVAIDSCTQNARGPRSSERTLVAGFLDVLESMSARLRNPLCIVLILVLCACGSEHRAAGPPVRLGAYMWPGNYWIDVAWAKGWFTEAGLNVERVVVEGKYFEALDSVAAGKIDAMGFAEFDLVRQVGAGQDLVGIAALDYSDGAEALVTRPGIHAVGDLAGKRVALKKGTYLEYLLSVAAEQSGVDISSVKIVDLAEEAAIQALARGEIDGFLSWEPYISRAVQASGGQSIFSTADFPGLSVVVLTSSRKFLDSHPSEALSLLRVWNRATQYIQQHRAESCEIVARLYRVTAQSACELMRTDRILDLSDNARAFSYAGSLDSLHGSWRRMNDFLMDRGLVDHRLDSPKHLRSDMIGAVRQESDNDGPRQ